MQSGDAFEQCCRQGPSGEGGTWELPDGTSLTLPPSVLARAGELWFDPAGASTWRARPGAGLADEILASVGQCSHDFRRQLLENVVLTGGGSSMRGLEARLTKELTEAAPNTMRPGTVPLPEYMPPNTLRHAAFMGGTIVAKTVFPTHQHISKRDYRACLPTPDGPVRLLTPRRSPYRREGAQHRHATVNTSAAHILFQYTQPRQNHTSRKKPATLSSLASSAASFDSGFCGDKRARSAAVLPVSFWAAPSAPASSSAAAYSPLP